MPFQQYRALLAEYDALLERLGNAKATSSAVSAYFYTPAPYSPLSLAHSDALITLAQLLKNPIYVTALTQRDLAPHYLEVGIEAQQVTYTTYYIDGSLVHLEPAEFPQLKDILGPVEHATRELGGSLRSDALLPLGTALSFYGVPPALFNQLDALIRHLEEARAVHHLRLGAVTDIGSLFQPGEHERVLDAVGEMLAQGETSVIVCLASQGLPGATVEQVRASPISCLDRLLHSPKARALAKRLIHVLDWYGAQTGEDSPSDIDPHLVAEALRLWYCDSFDDQPGTLVGFRLDKPEHWGKSYQTLRRDFEKHLGICGIIAETETDTLEGVLLGHLLLSKHSSDFAVPDVPPDLPYASTVTWVNFVHGVNLAQALEPGLLHRLSFQQLIDLPLRQSEQATDEMLQLIAVTRFEPAQRWAAATGNLHTVSITQALSELDKSTLELNQAIVQLNAQPAQRMALAKAEIERLFNTNSKSNTLMLMEAIIGRGKRSTSDSPALPPSVYEFAEVYAGGGFDHGLKWNLSFNGVARSPYWISLSPDNTIVTDDVWRDFTSKVVPKIHGRYLPPIEPLFNQYFERYLKDSKKAYEFLIRNLLVSLPWDDRQALAQHEVRIHSLKQIHNEMSALHLKEKITPSWQARMGFVLEAKPIQGDSRFYECLPRAGIIRRRHDINTEHLNPGIKKTLIFEDVPPLISPVNKQLPLDWQAYHQGAVPLENATCQGFLAQLGSAPAPSAIYSVNHGLTLSSPRTHRIASFFAEELFYYDIDELRATAWGETAFDRDRARPHWLESIKPFVPFWGSIDDLQSDDFGTRLLGAVGLVIDVLSFLVPLGKFAAGSIRLMITASRIGIRSALPAFSKLSGKLLKSTLENLNPLAIVSAGLKLSRKSLLLAGRGLYRAGRSSLTGVRTLTGATAHYDLVKGLTQITDPGSWKPLAHGDELATFKGIDDVPVRKINTSRSSRYCLIDPLSLKPFGPRLLMGSTDLLPGRSTFNSPGNVDDHALIEIPRGAQIQELFEIDGRTTLLIDDVGYRLDEDALRRADLIDESQRFKTVPCRVRRAPGNEVCQTRYVTRDPAPVPALGSVDESKGWATWFGDSIYTPAAGHRSMRAGDIARYTELDAVMEFRKGIYGRVNVSLPRSGETLTDTFQVGATLNQTMDGSKQYIFLRLNAADFYVAELDKGRSLLESLRFKKAATLPDTLRQELITVYTGSLNANNMARIYGPEAVERAMKTMEEIAIPIGGHTTPPTTLKHINVDTSPGEAVLFDHSTRMIVSRMSTGAASWSRSKTASDAFRQRTADIFDTLFVDKTTIHVRPDSDLKINQTMHKLQQLLPAHLQTRNARNIAYADIVTATGKREVYVSVSGAQGLTAELPLFKPPFAADKVMVGDTTYFNIDLGQTFNRTSLTVSDEGRLLAIPLTIKNIETYTPALTSRPTSLDSEAKLIGVLRKKYPDDSLITSIDVVTTMPPCNSCSVVIKEFGHDSGADSLQVLWQ